MNAAVIRFPGSNREGDIARALSQASGRPTPIVWHDEDALPARTDLVVLPGGFSYGDYLRCGAIAARARIMDAVRAHAARGGYVLGVCNGFQILCEAGLLPGVLMRNAGRTFVCRMQHLRVESDAGPLRERLSQRRSHQSRDRARRGQFRRRRRHHRDARKRRPRRLPLLRRRAATSRATIPTARSTPSPESPAKNSTCLGMMPHPENLIDKLVGGTDGRPMFAALAG